MIIVDQRFHGLTPHEMWVFVINEGFTMLDRKVALGL